QAEDGIRDDLVTGVQTCALPISQARAIQQVLLPTQFPRLDGFELTGHAQPARSVGGDYFDILALGDGKVAVCIGDVAGKGMPARSEERRVGKERKSTRSSAHRKR